MERTRGALAGLLVGAILSPIMCMFTFLLVCLLGMLSLTRVAVFEAAYRAISCLGDPYLATVAATCLLCSVLGYFRKWRFFSQRWVLTHHEC